MPDLTSETAVARYAVAPLDSAVNILQRLKDISERAEEICDRVLVAYDMAQGELEVFELYNLGDYLNDRRKSLEIEITAHDLFEVIDLIKKLTS